MLRLIEGGFFAGGHEKIKQEVLRLINGKTNTLMIVPEQETVSREREMTDFLPPSAALCFEVTNFTRFANSIFRKLGGVAGESINASKKALIMWKTLCELSPILETFGKREISVGSVSKILGAVKQLQSYSLTPDALADAKAKLDKKEGLAFDRRLIGKLSDMANIMTLYKKLISEHFTDSDDYLLIAEKKLLLSGASPISDTEIYIDGFTSFTEPQYRVINQLIKHCNVTVNLNLPKAGGDAFEYTEISKTHLRLTRLATLAECDIKLEKIDGRFGTAPLISEIVELLWRSSGKVSCDALSDTECFKIYEADDPHEECDFVAQDIKRRVMMGERYSDFGVIARSAADYEGILDVAFEKAGIPLFVASRTDISSLEAIKLIYSAFAAVTGGFLRRDVIAYSKCSLCGVERALADEFELYAEKWQINGKRFTDGIIWNMNPDGYSAIRREDSDEKLLRINTARDEIITPLMMLDEEIQRSTTVREYATALVNFLASLNVEELLAEKSKTDTSFIAEGKRYDLSRLWQIICDSLDSLCEVLGDTKVTPDTFINLLKITFSEADIGRIPAYLEQVTAGSADISRMYGKAHIYIIGASAGRFPLAVDDDSYFTDNDKFALGEIGLPIEADTDLCSARELYYFSRALSYAEKSVSVLYSVSDTSFKPTPPSEAVARIISVTDGAIKPLRISSMLPSMRVFTDEYAIEHLYTCNEDFDAIRDALTDTGNAERLRISEAPIKNADLRLSAESSALLYRDSIRMSQSKLEKYIGCPMNYFCSYNLRLDNQERVEFDNRNIGIFIHSILENFFKELKLRGKKIADITEDEKRALVKNVATEYVRAAFSGVGELPARLKNTIDNLCRFSMPVIDSLCDEFSECDFEPIFFELDIDKNNPDTPEPPIFKTSDGKEIYFTGKIDRVDAYKKGDDVYVRVIDYKTGAKEFKPTDIAEGKNLQMFLYLKAIVESDKPDFKKRMGAASGKLIPAGVIYVKANVVGGRITRNNSLEALNEAKKGQGREGMLLDDSDSISAMNASYIPIKFKVDGTPDSYSKAKLYTAVGWSEINRTIERIVTDECTKMVFGDISATPLKEKRGNASVCKYCDYKPICRNANAPRDHK